jgi:hypothetical protein
MSLHQNSQQNNAVNATPEGRRNIGEISTYAAFIQCQQFIQLSNDSAVEDVEVASAIADHLCHWFDRHRAVHQIAERVGVDVDLIFRLMRRGAN